MSTPSARLPRVGSHRRAAAPAWLREPLLHFVVIGAVLFGADHLVSSHAGDPRLIVVGSEADAEARKVFQAQRGRPPNADELRALRKVWLDNEVLYREGLALQVDKGDTTIRDRVIFKALSVIDASVQRPPIDDPQLRQWFEAHRVRYDEPARFDFDEAVLAGETGEAAVRGFVQALNAGTPGDAKAGLRVFKGRPQANLVQSYGADFATAVQTLAPGEWTALSSPDGWRAVRLNAVVAAKPAQFEPLRGVVLQDWTDAVLAEQRSAAVAALAKKYRIVEEAQTP